MAGEAMDMKIYCIHRHIRDPNIIYHRLQNKDRFRVNTDCFAVILIAILKSLPGEALRIDKTSFSSRIPSPIQPT